MALNTKFFSQFPPGNAVKLTDKFLALDTTDVSPSHPQGVVKLYSLGQLQDYIDAKTINSNVESARVATTENLIAGYVNGDSGIGATLTNSSTLEPLIIDGVSVVVGDRILVWNQNQALQNGVYDVTVVGTITTAWVLTRSTDFNGHVPGQIARGDFIGVFQGGTNALEFFFMTADTPLVVGTDPITWAKNVSSGPSPGQSWFVISALSQSMITNAGYITNTFALCTLTLPLSANVGDEIKIIARGTSFFRIAQNSGQSIFFGNLSTTNGVTGYIQSVDLHSSITIVCTVTDTEFTVLNSPQGATYTII